MRKRQLKKNIKRKVSEAVDHEIEYQRLICSCFFVLDRCYLNRDPWTIRTGAILLDPTNKREVKEFKKKTSSLRLALHKEAYFLVTGIEVVEKIKEPDRSGVEYLFGYERSILRDLINSLSQPEEIKVIEMAFLIIQNLNYLWSKKEAAPHLLSLMIFTKWTDGHSHSPTFLKAAMDDAFSRYIDKKVRLNDKLADIDLEFLVRFRKALRLLLQSGALSRTIFNTIWETDNLRSKLALPENGSFSYLPVMSPNRRIP